MTLLATKFERAKNWTERLKVAREIWREVHEEREQDERKVEIEGEYQGEER